MATVVLFHSALGLRPAVQRFADALRADGHTVHTPDLFDGEVFDVLADGVRKRDALGIPELIGRAQAAVAALPGEVVYAGFSMGAASAELLAGTRPGARGAILMHAAIAPAMIGVPVWPAVPMQIHYGARDPWVDVADVDALAQGVRASGAQCDVYTYEAPGHLFADEQSEDFDAPAAEAMLERVRAFLGAT